MDKSKKSAPILVQLTIFASILIVSSVLSSFFPKAFSVPAAVIGTILLYWAADFEGHQYKLITQYQLIRKQSLEN